MSESELNENEGRIKAENVRNLLGEIYVYCQQTATLDDVTMVQRWNTIPLPVREWGLSLALVALPRLVEETNKTAADRISRILVALEQMKAIKSLEGEQIAIAECGPFDQEPAQGEGIIEIPPEAAGN